MHQHAGTSRNIETVNAYLDGFRKNDHEQILSCLTDDIEWTVFGAFRLTGKEAYDKAIDGAPEFIDLPSWRWCAWLRKATSSWRSSAARRSAPRAERCGCPWQRCSSCATAGSLSAVPG